MHFSNLDLFTAADHLPNYLLGSKGASYKVEETPFQDAVGTSKPRWEWLEEKVAPNSTHDGSGGYPGLPGSAHPGALTNGHVKVKGGESEVSPRPELDIFGLAMVGGGNVFGLAHPYGKDALPQNAHISSI